ncbi:MAG: hypothetical protein K5695_16345 [Oscillospiraceae bacterium]|nr:hypothetical protein [Oscillospiraceae bacterium]
MLSERTRKNNQNTHNFRYFPWGNILTAHCYEEGCSLEEGDIALEICAQDDPVFDRTAKTASFDGLAAFNAETGLNLSEDDIVYYRWNPELETDVNTYFITITGQGNYGDTNLIYWNITKAANTGTVTIKGTDEEGRKVYDGKAVEPVLTLPEELPANGPAVTYKYWKKMGSYWSGHGDIAPKDAGKYKVEIYIPESANYNSRTIEYEFEILQRPVTITPIA